MDYSGSVGPTDWQLLLNFMATVVSTLDIGAQKTRVASVSFGTKFQVETEAKCRCRLP